MKKLIINFENCYGICKLEAEFDFTKKNTCAIYAPNGVMKTSFARSFKDISDGNNPKDVIFPERTTVCSIIDETAITLAPDQIFVIEPYNEQFYSNKLSTLLVSNDLKQEYDAIYQELETEKKNFITKLKAVSQSSDCETEFIGTFKDEINSNFFEILNEVTNSVSDNRPKYDFKYNDIFDKKGSVKKFLEKHQDFLDVYIQNYETLISKSNFFKKSNNTFGTYQASELFDSISNESFFEAGHHFELADQTIIRSAKEFKKILQNEINKIVNDAELKKSFDKVDKALGSNSELRAFKTVLERNNLLLIELKSYDDFKKKVWKSYIIQLKTEAASLVSLYLTRKQQIEDIIAKAKSEETEWEKSINEFNLRFKGLPFKLILQNKTDVMLNTSTPTVGFEFHDRDEHKSVDRGQLLVVLSQGERRALYLLNIIFEIRARKKSNQKTLFIIDDIADSFDYKNKYAIIEYLNDIAENPTFYQIILTHNFDFFRTLESRGIVGYSCCYYTYKTKTKVTIDKVSGGLRNPFINDWKKNLNDDKKLIASIPFIRNIIEYTKGESEPDYLLLTGLLHWKNNTDSMLISDLKVIFENNIIDITFPTQKLSTKILEVIYQEAEQCLTVAEGMNFENKIVLSIAIRLKAEKLMIDEINDPSFIQAIVKNQTYNLIKKYKELFPTNVNAIYLFEQVNLMTPENIHLNSFMYEPIIDLGIEHLKDLYLEIKKLTP